MRRVVPRSSQLNLARVRRRSARRRAISLHDASRPLWTAYPCPSLGLEVLRPTDAGVDVRYRARLALSAALSKGDEHVVRAFSEVVMCASKADADGPVTPLRQTVWTERGGNMVVELRSESPRLSSGVARLVEPVLEGYVTGALKAARILGEKNEGALTVDVSRTQDAAGAVVVRVVLYGQTEGVASRQPSAPAFVPTRRSRQLQLAVA
jgi:hypothetical protein